MNEELIDIDDIEEVSTTDLEVDYDVEDITDNKPVKNKKLNSRQELDLQAFNLSATMSHREIVRALGREEMYANMPTAVADISRRINRVAKNPSKYGVSSDKAEQTKTIVVSRNSMVVNARKREENIKEVSKKEKKTIDQLVLEGRNKSWVVFNMKLDEALKDPKKRDKISMGELAKVAGITFDKGQLVDGKATEHVAIMSKMNTEKMNTQDALEAVLKMREVNEQSSDEQR